MAFFGTELIDKLPSNTIENPQFISEHIRKRRQELKMFQVEVSKLLGVCEDTITGWENGRTFPQIQHYRKLIEFLGYNPFPVDDTTFGGKIKKFRAEQGISQRVFARMMQVDETTICSWETGTHTPGPRKMKLLNKVINQKEPPQ